MFSSFYLAMSIETAGVQLHPAPSTVGDPCTSRIFRAIWELKKNCRKEAMLLDISKRLKQLSMETDLDNPETVKEHIAKIFRKRK